MILMIISDKLSTKKKTVLNLLEELWQEADDSRASCIRTSNYGERKDPKDRGHLPRAISIQFLFAKRTVSGTVKH